jgi:hypothetical protein
MRKRIPYTGIKMLGSDDCEIYEVKNMLEYEPQNG